MLQKSRQSLRTVNISIDVDEEKVIISNGNFVKYETGNGNIRIRTNEGVDIIRGVGGSIKVSEYTEIYITNLHTANDAKTITVGYGDVSDNAVSGTVDVDNITLLEKVTKVEILERDKTKFIDTLENENTFMMGLSVGSSAGQYGQMGLHNPTGSGVNLILQKAIISTVVTSTCYIDTYVTPIPGAVVFKGLNKFIGKTDSLANIERISSATLFTVNQLSIISTSVYIQVDTLKGDNIIIPPGNGVLLRVGVVAVDIRPIFKWKEVAI